MKRSYESPLMSIELFMANQAVSACTVEGGVDWTFDCMKDNGEIQLKVVSAQISTEGSCDLKVGYAPSIRTARDYDSNGTHSDHNSNIAQWGNGSDQDGSYLQVTYTGAEGLLYVDQVNKHTVTLDAWSVVPSGAYIKHVNSGSGPHHLVAPVMNTLTINASW